MRNSAGVKRDFVALGKRHFESVMLLEKSYLNQSEVARGRPRGFEEGGQAGHCSRFKLPPPQTKSRFRVVKISPQGELAAEWHVWSESVTYALSVVSKTMLSGP